MQRDELGDLNAFLTVAEERSVTRASARLGTSQSALSHTVRRLETRLGMRLLTRTTRSVAPTQAGERLLGTLRPALDSIGAELAALGELRERPSGTIRITASQHAVDPRRLPGRARRSPEYTDVHVELSVDAAFTDIVAERFDAGVRLGEALARDMVAVRVGPDLRMAVVGAPAYLAGRTIPKTPQELTAHACINLRQRSEARAGSTPGSWRRTGANCASASTASSCSTTSAWSRAPRSPGSGWRSLWRIMSRRRSPVAAWSGCWRIGARHSRATISTIPSAASPRPPSRCWWMRCAIGVEGSPGQVMKVRGRDGWPARLPTLDFD